MAVSSSSQDVPLPFNTGTRQPDIYDLSWESFTFDVLQDQVDQLYELETSTDVRSPGVREFQV